MDTLADFLSSLRAGGVAALGGEKEPAEGDVAPGLAGLDADARLEFPGEAPDFRPEVALWATRLLQRICQAIAKREIAASEASTWLQTPCPAPLDAATVFSADLLLHHLPDLLALARRMSADDPVVAGLLELARAWPFSSVRVSECGDSDAPALAIIAAHPGLLAEYADRVLARTDLARVGRHPAVDEALRAALGAHDSLAPKIAARLRGDAASSAA